MLHRLEKKTLIGSQAICEAAMKLLWFLLPVPMPVHRSRRPRRFKLLENLMLAAHPCVGRSVSRSVCNRSRVSQHRRPPGRSPDRPPDPRVYIQLGSGRVRFFFDFYDHLRDERHRQTQTTSQCLPKHKTNRKMIEIDARERNRESLKRFI